MNILLVVPSFKILGGVANHYQGLAPYWKNRISYFFYGKRIGIPAIVTFIPDLVVFIFKMIFIRYDVVIVNPSLRSYQLFRDGLYILIAHIFGKKVVTFIHGWGDDMENKLLHDSKLFCKVYGKSKFVYVLYSGFKDFLQKIPLNTPVLLTTTKVKNSFIEGFDISHRKGKIETLLFLARADKLKGLDITIKTFEILKRNNPYLKLKVCGTGNALQDAIDYVKDNGIKDVEFMGHVTGNDVATQFVSSDLYILPTTHGEGMATSVLEAMALGLPIITRPMGGVKDFFKDGEMGFLLESLSPVDYAKAIQLLIDNPQMTANISHNNHFYAVENFLASKVTKKFEDDINEYCL